MTEPNKIKRKKLLILLGIVCIALGLVINEITLEHFIASDGAIENPFYRAIIVIFQVAIGSLGLCFIFIRLRLPLANAFLVLSTTLFSLLAGELILRVLYKPPAVIAGWRSFVPESEKNQQGFRGRPIRYNDNNYVIVLLGDSYAEGFGCEFESMPECRLELHLNAYNTPVKIFTLAAGGYGQDQQLLILREYYETFRADLVILWQIPKNDIWNNVFPTHWPKDGMPKPTFILKNDSLCGPSWQMGELLYHSPLRLVSLIKHVRAFGSRDKRWERYIPEPYSPMTDYNGQVSQEWQVRWDKDIGGMREENLDNEKSHLAPWLAPRSERMEYGLKLTRLLIREINELVTSHNGQFILFRVAVRTQSTTPEDTVYTLNGRYYRTSTKQFEENMAYISQGFNTYVIPVTVENWRVKPEDAHLNEVAVDQVMNDLALVLKDVIRTGKTVGNREIF